LTEAIDCEGLAILSVDDHRMFALGGGENREQVMM